MSFILNRYMHAYVILPVVASFVEHNVFKDISLGKKELEIIKSQGANSGYFNIALRLFESLGWVCRETEAIKITEKLPQPNKFLGGFVGFYDIPFEDCLGERGMSMEDFFDNLHLPRYLDYLKEAEYENDFFNSFDCIAAGAIALPVLYVLSSTTDMPEINCAISHISAKHRENIIHLLVLCGLLQRGSSIEEYVTTDLGRALWGSIKNAGVTLSYRPLLAKIEQLLFYDVNNLFQRLDEETHVTRELNVIGSGAQHEVFFKDFIGHIKEYINLSDVDVLRLVDMGCGDGTLLKNSYNTIDIKTRRDKKLTLIGVDLNKPALNITARNLDDIPNYLCTGNIIDPRSLIANLSLQGFDKNELLHMRTFLDHNCPLNKNLVKKEGLSTTDSHDDVYADDEGNAVSNTSIVKNLNENFKNWSDCVGKHGLLTLEVFSLSPSTVNKYLEETESLHFDALHGFSNQYLVSANAYLLAAANAGLFIDKVSFIKYPHSLPYCRISQQHFFKKDFLIRTALESDIDALVYLEDVSLPENLRASRENLKKRLSQCAHGIYLAFKEVNDETHLVGALYTQRINREGDLQHMKYDSVETYHDNKGKICQLISLQIDPSQQDGVLAKELLSFGILNNFVKEGIRKVVGISRCAMYRASKGDYLEYAKNNNKFGHSRDPILRMHQQEGAKIVDVVAGYRNKDIDNLGYGVHIAYEFRSWLKSI